MKLSKLLIFLIITLSFLIGISLFIKNKYKNKFSSNLAILNESLLSYSTNLKKYQQYIYNAALDYENSLSQISKEDYINASLPAKEEESIRFCIIIPSYNNINYTKQSINSVFRQNYHNWRLLFIDDASNDGMTDLVKQIKEESKLSEYKFTLKINEERTRSALYNFYYGTHDFCEDNEVLVMLDGDDMLAHSKVLSKLAEVYQDKNIWLTYGNQLALANNTVFDTNKEFPINTWENIRSNDFTTSHPHTVYVWLFNKIAEDDLKYNNQFFTSAWDLAFMYPILEMAGPYRSKSLNDILYIYRSHANNDGKLYPEEQAFLDKYIRNKEPYKILP